MGCCDMRDSASVCRKSNRLLNELLFAGADSAHVLHRDMRWRRPCSRHVKCARACHTCTGCSSNTTTTTINSSAIDSHIHISQNHRRGSYSCCQFSPSTLPCSFPLLNAFPLCFASQKPLMYQPAAARSSSRGRHHIVPVSPLSQASLR